MTDAERRDQSLRTVELPDCCGNCIHWTGQFKGWQLCGHRQREQITYTLFNQLCDLHERISRV